MRPLLSITKAATQQFRTILSQEKREAIFIGLKSGGCSGFEYKIKPTDTVGPEDECLIVDNVKFVVCGKSLMYLLGTTVDWSNDIMGNRFTFDNPNSQNTCGCGTSFNPFMD